MNENATSDLSVETYIKKQENLLLEHIRRQLQSDTRVTLLEMALQDAYRVNEDLSSQIATLKTTVDQSINGLKSLTVERDTLKGRTEEIPSLVGELARSKNNVALLEDEVKSLNTKLEVAAGDYATLKGNYNKVVAALNEAEQKNAVGEANVVAVLAPKGKQSKKMQNTNAEWVDGEYNIQT